MHDPMVVAFDIRRPWPTRRAEKVRPGQPRWEVTIYRKHGRDHNGWNPRRWWRPGSWSPFVNAFGRRWYFPSLVTIWHVEPGGRDSGQVCKHWVDGKHRSRWRWHFWHWSIQVRPIQTLGRFLFERCIECGRRYPYGYAPVSHSWSEPGGRWFRVQRRAYHHECSALVSLRSAAREHELIHYRALAALALEWDVPIEDVPRRLFSGTDGYRFDREKGGTVVGDFNLRYRLDNLIEKGEPTRTITRESHA